MAIDQEYKERRVNSLPTSGLSAGDKYALNVGGGKYQTYVVSDSLQLVKEAGADFIEKDTISELRAITAREIWAIQNGYYKGVKLNGYYTKGDTPAPIEYFLSSTTNADNGGSVIEVGDIKLGHDFGSLINLAYFGAIGIDTDMSSQIQKAIDASQLYGTIEVSGAVRSYKPIYVTKILIIRGNNSAVSNDTGASNSSRILFSSPTAADITTNSCLNVTGALTLENISIIGTSLPTDNTFTGIYVKLSNIKTNNVTVQGFYNNLTVSECYYTKLNNSYFGYSKKTIIIDYCYNFVISNSSIKTDITANDTAIELKNGSVVTILGSSIEGFKNIGIKIGSGCKLSTFGAYYEGSGNPSNSGLGVAISMADDSDFTNISSQVYGTSFSAFISSPSLIVKGIRLYSRNNKIMYPLGADGFFRVYSLSKESIENNSMIDIDGDNYDSSVTGTNVRYLGFPRADFRGVDYSKCNLNIIFPKDHPWYQMPIISLNRNQYVSSSNIASFDGAEVLASNIGKTGDDPLNLRATPWGYNVYKAIYQKGRWEKIGLRLDNIQSPTEPVQKTTEADATDIDTAISLINDLKSKYNEATELIESLKTKQAELFSKLRGNGVMI